MLETVKDVLMDFLIVGVPFFIIGVLTTLTFMANEKYKIDERKENTRNMRVNYICYLIDLVKKKRRDESKIDVD